MNYYHCSGKSCEYVCEEPLPEFCPLCDHPHFHLIEENEISDLGWCFLGQSASNRDDWEHAIQYFTKGIEHEDYPIAQFGLAYCYEAAYEDYEKAIPLYLAAAKEGVYPAQYELALCYLHGEGVEKDGQQAAYWFQKAADQGDKRSFYELGRLYENGDGVEKNVDKATNYYMSAALLGDADAMTRFADCLLDGIGVKQNDKAAATWYHDAAETGHVEAAFKYARMLDVGRGCERNRNMALQLYLECAASGLVEARALLKERGIPFEK